MLDYIRHKSTIYSFIADIIILVGVFFLDWDPIRVIAFVCLDIEVMILFFFVFMKLSGEIEDLFSLLLGFLVLSIMSLISFYLLLSIKGEFENTRTNIKVEDIKGFFVPYYDVGIFVLFSGMNHFLIVREIVKAKNKIKAMFFVTKAVVYRMLLVPVIFFIACYISIIFHSNIYTTPFVLLIIAKEVSEYWKFKALRNINIKADI